jgi:hypothetical protein
VPINIIIIIQHGMLKIRTRTDKPGDESFANEVVRMPMESVVFSVLPGCIDMFALSSKDGKGTDNEVYNSIATQGTKRHETNGLPSSADKALHYT